MISEILIDAIGDIGDEYIDEYARLRTAYKDKRSNLKRIWIAASAACICLAVLATAYVIKSSNNPDVELALKNTESPDYVVKVTKEPEVIVDTKLPTAEPTDVPVIEPTEIIMETENPIMIVTSEPEETTEQVTEAPTEKDWQSEWTYFIAHLDSEQGKGVTAHPDDKIYKTFSADISPNYTDEEFKSNSIWLFEVNYNGSLYRACKSQITKADIGAYLQNIDLCIYERRLINYNFKETVSLFTINNISPDAALAISIGQDEYYILVNTNYKPSSFIQFINDFNLKQTTDLNEIAYFDKSGNVINQLK